MITVVLGLVFSCGASPGNGLPPSPLPDPSPNPTTKPTKDNLVGIDFEIARRDAVYEPGTPIMVDAVLRNRRDRVAVVPERRGVDDERNCVLVVRAAETGRLARLTEYGQKLYAPKPVERLRERWVKLAKGDTIENVLEVTKVYDLSAPGKYSIQAVRHLLDDRGRYAIPVRSNTLEVTVALPRR